MNPHKLKILHLPVWYPERNRPLSGLFIRKHIKSLRTYCDNAALYIHSDGNMKNGIYDIETSWEEEIFTVRIYYKKVKTKIPFVSHALKFFRYTRASFLGFTIIRKIFGYPDLVHVHVLNEIRFQALWLKFFRGIDFVVSEQWTGYIPADGTYRGFLLKMFTRLIIRNTSAVTVVSNALMDAMKNHGLKGKFYIVPNVVEDVDYRCFPHKGTGKVIILVVADLIDYHKNISDVIRVFAKISDKYVNIYLHIIGDGQDRCNLENLSGSSGLAGKNVFFHGEIPNEDVYEMMRNASFLITNSNFETFSVVTAEAIANGIPVIATRCGGPADFVTEENGILIEPDNPEQLEKAIVQMIECCKNYDKKKLCLFAKEKFSYEVVGKQFYDIYMKVIDK